MIMRNKVLLIVHDFPGNGGLRFVKFVQHLPGANYEPLVLTVKGRSGHTDGAGSDREVRILRTACLHKSPFRVFSKLFGAWSLTTYLESLFFVPDLFVTWIPSALIKGIRLIREEHIPVVVTTSPPESLHIIGLLLKRFTGVKWIADFQDLWTTKKVVYRAPTRLHDAMVKRLEKTVYAQADHIVANTHGNKRFYLDLFSIPESKVTVIPNGYDRTERDLTPLPDYRDQKEFSIGYMGYFDKPGFPWKEFLRAFLLVLKATEGTKVKLNVAGYVSKDARRFIEAEGLSDHVVLYGDLPHREAFQLIRRCHILLLLMYETPYSKAIVPHKLYYYLAMGRRVIAFAEEDGEVSQIIERTNVGKTFSSKNLEGATEALLGAFQEWKACGFVRSFPDMDAVAAYEYGVLTNTLARIMTLLLPDPRTSPQAQSDCGAGKSPPTKSSLLPPPGYASNHPHEY
jgi:glycosyltransferase involved in cell wall biosynthesis